MLMPLIELLNSVYTETSESDAEKAKAKATQEAEAAKLAEAEAAKIAEAEAAEKAKLDDEEMVPIADLRKFRAEAAANRKEAVTLQAKLDSVTKAQEKATADAEIAKLEGIEKEQARTAQVEKDLADANATITAKDAKLTADAINTAVYRAANDAGFESPEDAPALLDLSGIEVNDGEIDQDEIDELVKTLADSKPYLLKEQIPEDAMGGPNNPPNPKGGPKVRLTGVAEIEKLKQQSAEARERGDMVTATQLYNRAWEQERGVKPGG